MAVHPGDPAPDFTAEAHNGQHVRLTPTWASASLWSWRTRLDNPMATVERRRGQSNFPVTESSKSVSGR
jgi:hypothetical protein